MTTTWTPYTGTDEQIAEIRCAVCGFVAKNNDVTSNILVVRCNQLFVRGEKRPILPELFGDTLKQFLDHNRTTHYLICNPHPLADMIIRQCQTWQQVYIKYCWPAVNKYDTTEYSYAVTTTPDWNIPCAEYLFTPFDDEK